MLWLVARVASAGPLSDGAWVSSPTSVPDVGVAAAGSPDAGWLVVESRGGVLYGQRVAPDGALVDPTPVEVQPAMSDLEAMWDGAAFVVVSATMEDYYEHIGTVEAARIPANGALVPTREVLATGLGWPRDLEGACGDGSCVLALRDLHWEADGIARRLTFDATGVTKPIEPIEGGYGEVPFAAVRDGDYTLVGIDDFATGPELLWLPEASAAPERLPVPAAHELAVGTGGVVLTAWVERDGAPGDSASPNFGARVLAQRVQRGVGALDPSPLDLGGASTFARLDVVFDGAAFVVAIEDPEEEIHQLVRVEVDGAVADPVEVPDADPTAYRGELVAGAPGHLLWLRAACPNDDPSTPSCDEYERGYVIIEIDVPDGGACSADDACISGFCVAGLCAAGPATGDTGGDTGLGDTGSIDTGGAGSGTGDTGGVDPNGCGCGSVRPGPGVLTLLLVGLVGRRRR